MSGGYVSLSTEGRIGVVRLERPDALNAVSSAMADELAQAFRRVAADDEVWVVLLTAAGDKAFCVGADLKERASFGDDDFYRNRGQIRSMFAALRAVPQPTIAAVFGYALGGGFELALSCDLIVAAEGTEMGLPEARVGLLPAGGGTQLLARKAGVTQAKEAIFTGARMDARRWADLGVVSRVAPIYQVEDSAHELAAEICRSSPVAVREAKASIDAALGVPLEQGVDIEDRSWARVVVSADRKEGIAAFNDKRDPQWRNR